MTAMFDSVSSRLLAIPFVAAALVIGCGGGTLQSPTGPSATPAVSTFQTSDADSGATASSTGEFSTLGKGGNGGGKGQDKDKDKDKEKDKDKDKDKAGEDAPSDGPSRGPGEGDGPGRSREDKVAGFVTAKTGDRLTVRGIAVVAGTGAIIRHGNRILTLAAIEVGHHVQARGSMEGTTLVATEIKVQDTGDDNDDVDEVEVKGAISSLSPTSGCPIVTFMIGTTKVTTSASTVFDDVTCATVANNAVVEVEGTRLADGSIAATKIEAEGTENPES